jgi:hypothetical protein
MNRMIGIWALKTGLERQVHIKQQRNRNEKDERR